MAIRALEIREIQAVSGAGWDDVGDIVVGVIAVGGGAAYSYSTGTVGAYLGGGAAMYSGMTLIIDGFEGLLEDWYGSS